MKHNNISEKDYNISEQDLLNKQDLSHHIENNTKENTEIKSSDKSNTKEVLYPRKRKFKNSREIEKYLLTTYYKHYAEEDDLPNYLIRDIILYKLSSFKLFVSPIDSKDILGKPNEYGTVLYFNTLLQKELEFQREIQDVLESEIFTKELSNEDRKKIEDLNKNLDKLIKSVRDAYTQAKNLYKITKREEDRRRN